MQTAQPIILLLELLVHFQQLGKLALLIGCVLLEGLAK